MFLTIHDIELAGFGCTGSCRECTSPRDDERSKPKGWIRENTQIGPVLEVKVANYLQRYGIEVKIDSKQNDGSQSWTDQWRYQQVRNLASGREREPHSLRKSGTWCGETRCDKTTGTNHTVFIFIFIDYCADRSREMEWHSCCWKHWPQRGSDKKRFQYCLGSDGFLLHMRAIQGLSGGNKVDPSLQENVEIPYNWIEYIYPVGSSHDCQSIILSSLIAGRNDTKERRQTVNSTLHSRGPCEGTTRRWTLWMWHNHDRYLTEPDGKCERTLANSIQCHHLSCVRTSRLSWKSDEYQNWRYCVS